jgi:nicotinamide-nucleotide amidase
MNKANIISIGGELLIGDTVNTNATWIGSFLTEQGFSVEQVFTIPDSYDLITRRIRESLESAELTVVTGGLGPTHDDITKKAVADIFNAAMVENEQVLLHIKKIFEKRNFIFSRSNADQALVPENGDVLFNNKGTAPGMWFCENGHYLAVLPGVPHEMKFLMEERVLPKITENFPGRDVWATQYLRTAGVPESTLSDRIGDLDKYVNNGIGVAYLPGASGVTIRLSASGRKMDEAQKKLVEVRNLLYEKAGDVIYGEGRELTLARVVGKMLAERSLTIAVAESCTGGLLSNEITDVPGSSEYMLGGVVAYANSAKVHQLGVDEKTLKQHGAVSGQTALEMAEGIADRYGADIGVSTTGIAGPGGGTEDKPVGTVWMGFKTGTDHFALKAVLGNDRLINKERTAMIVLETIRRHLMGLQHYPYNLKPYRA